MANNPLIVALDVETFEEAKRLVEELKNDVGAFKIGLQMYTAYGPFIVHYVQAQGCKVFLDLKFHDIPNTVANAVKSAVGLSVPGHNAVAGDKKTTLPFEPLFMMTIHTIGGFEMMQAAAKACAEEAAKLKVKRPVIVGVTVLTSDPKTANLEQRVLERAKLAKEAGLDGVVASPQEAELIRRVLGKDFIIVTPGIRPADSEQGDQKRVATPGSAIQSGSSYLVVGRPIVQAPSPVATAKKILEEIKSAQ